MVLVSIVGDHYSSILPIFYEFHDKIKKHIVIYDDFKNDVMVAGKIIKGTQKFIQKYSLAIKTVAIKLDEDSQDAIEKAIEHIKQHAPQYKKLYINATDGLYSLSFKISKYFNAKGAKIIAYDRYDNSYILIKNNSQKIKSMQKTLSIVDHLLLKNIDIINLADTTFAKKYKKHIQLFFEKYDANIEEFKADFPNSEILSYQSGFLYEFYIYNLIRKLNFDDIAVGVKVADRYNNTEILNEFDLLVMKENHLHIIECKFKKQEDIAMLIYKLDSIRSTIDEDSNILVVTNFDQYYLNNQSHSYKRARLKRIAFVGSVIKQPKRFISDVDNFFTLKSKNLGEILKNTKSYLSKKEQKEAKMKQKMDNYLRKNLSINFEMLRTLQDPKSYFLSRDIYLYEKIQKDSVLKTFIAIIKDIDKKKGVTLQTAWEYFQNYLK